MINESEEDFEERLLRILGDLSQFAHKLNSDQDKAKDLLHDTILKVLDNRDKYVNDSNYRGWALTIMKNIFINNHYKDNRISLTLDQDEKSSFADIPYESGFVASGGECTLKDIRQAVSSVANEYRIPFSMHIAGYKYEEIATFMNLPIGTVKSRIYYTRKKLQILLKDYRDDY